MKYTPTLLFINHLLLIVVAVSGILLLVRGTLRSTLAGAAVWVYTACVLLSVLYLLAYRRASARTTRVLGIATNCALLIVFLQQLILARHQESLALNLVLVGLVVAFVGVPLGLMVTGKAEGAS